MIPTDRTGFRDRKQQNSMATTNEILASVSRQVRASESRILEKINALQGAKVMDMLQSVLGGCEEISFVPYNFEERGYNFYITLIK